MTTLDDLLSSASEPEPRRQPLWLWMGALVVLLVAGIVAGCYLVWG